LKFDGRIAEDFKLATGTFVSVGPLRAKIMAAGAPYVQDVVLTGINLKEVGALVIPTAAGRSLQSDAAAEHFQRLVNELAKTATGSANRIARLHVMHEPLLIDKGEVTDKGSVNQRAVLTHRSELVDALHADAIQPIFKPKLN
jgi:feruloyl-CoA synthase